jgi:hypothetical protein
VRFVAAAGLLLALARPCVAAELELPAPGTARPEVAGLEDFACETEPRVSRCRLKPGLARTFAGAPVEDAILDIREGRVAVAAVFFDEQRFPAVAERLAADFGPGEDHSEALRAGMGATFTNVVKAWRREGAVWFAEQFAGRITRSAVSRVPVTEFDGMMAARAAQRVNGARDL